MVLLVPDDPDDSLEEREQDPRPKAQLDDSEASRAARKVDLDLDDAPFLEDEEEEEEALEEVAPQPQALEQPKERKPLPPWLKNKFVLIGAPAVLLLVAGLIFFLTRPKPPANEQPTPEAPPVEQPPAPAPEPQIPDEMSQEHLVKLDPFLVEQTDPADGRIRFLEVQLVFSTPDERLSNNLVRLTPTVRYAIFYYLKNKDLTFLTDETHSEALKQELLAVVNQYMADGLFKNVLFETYLVK